MLHLRPFLLKLGRRCFLSKSKYGDRTIRHTVTLSLHNILINDCNISTYQYIIIVLGTRMWMYLWRKDWQQNDWMLATNFVILMLSFQNSKCNHLLWNAAVRWQRFTFEASHIIIAYLILTYVHAHLTTTYTFNTLTLQLQLPYSILLQPGCLRADDSELVNM